MAKNMDRDKLKIRNAQVGLVFSESEEITSQVKGTLGTGTPTDFFLIVDDDGAVALSFEQLREQSSPNGSSIQNSARVTVYLSASAAAKFLETLEHERFTQARDRDATKREPKDWNPFV